MVKFKNTWRIRSADNKYHIFKFRSRSACREYINYLGSGTPVKAEFVISYEN
jgi:hypothetical protein